MNRILKIGMDVHSTNYTLCIVEPKIDGNPDRLYEVQVEPDYLNHEGKTAATHPEWRQFFL